MRYFYDTEFWEDGPLQPIILISIGIVAEDGREYYAVNANVPWDAVRRSASGPWLENNVRPHLGGIAIPFLDIREEVNEFLDPRPSELWAYFADYDHVVLCQLFGRMIDLPRGMPMFTHDLMQEMARRGFKRNDMPYQAGAEHNALEDARWVREAWLSLQ